MTISRASPLEITQNTRLSREPAAHNSPLPSRVGQLDIEPARQRSGHLIYFHQWQMPPGAHARAAAKRQLGCFHVPEAVLVGTLTLVGHP